MHNDAAQIAQAQLHFLWSCDTNATMMRVSGCVA